MRRTLLFSTLVSIAVAVSMVAGCAQPAVEVDPDDIGGRVTSESGPEAGVWVVAETTDLPTRFIRIVATDDEGLYLLPDLPEASYEIFVRGYGLVDSPRVTAAPGDHLDLIGIVAPDSAAAAEVYPAAWWLSPTAQCNLRALTGTIWVARACKLARTLLWWCSRAN